MSVEGDIRTISHQFYTALNRVLNGDAGLMADVWSHSADVTTMRPLGGRELGWKEVQKAWEAYAEVASDGHVELTKQLIQIGGEQAYEVGTERFTVSLAGQMVSGEHRVTNIYRRKDGTWKLVHHHTDYQPEVQEILSRLQSEE